MKLWKIISRRNRRERELVKNDGLQLLLEIDKAHKEWVTAQHRLDYVLEKEQIDYAVYALEAAEKRFEMLIKQAKQMNLSAMDVYRTRAVEG
ncbi:YaaL family protein [Paenibacillus doosanensis]|uniref:DUF2508 domain-containing protein n=1 Tax=Paenibacillus konkukensis TaxID=2020716 RepID=A0ABY4RRV4_9BACL|nr:MULTISPECIES: DUF2508 family protein [Paenibacillus]MCS7464542.1 YaaL family protein [Paenibacillus doosanensis]UQZ84873.1 hypothetical protein SK3146_04128 [Paenibacillus konkukensis]